MDELTTAATESNTSSVPPKLFNDVSFCVSGNVSPKIIKQLEAGGGKSRTYAGMGVTHFLAGEGAVELRLEEAKDIFEIPIVQPRWVEYCAKLSKIISTNGFNGEPNQLFSKIIITPSGIYGQDLKHLWALVTYYGGNFSKNLTKRTTHLIINSCQGSMFEKAKQAGVKIVCADWLTDSIKTGQLQEVRAYHPSLVFTPSSLASAPPPPPSIPIPAAPHPAPVTSAVPTAAPPGVTAPVRIESVETKFAPIAGPPRIPTPPVPRMPQQQLQQQPPPGPVPGPGPPPQQQYHPIPTSQEQVDIIRYIRSNPDLRDQWSQIGEEQRALVIQKLAQKHRDEQLRRQMMLRQQQQQQQQQQQNQNLQGSHQTNISNIQALQNQSNNMNIQGSQSPAAHHPQMPPNINLQTSSLVQQQQQQQQHPPNINLQGVQNQPQHPQTLNLQQVSSPLPHHPSQSPQHQQSNIMSPHPPLPPPNINLQGSRSPAPLTPHSQQNINLQAQQQQLQQHPPNINLQGSLSPRPSNIPISSHQQQNLFQNQQIHPQQQQQQQQNYQITQQNLVQTSSSQLSQQQAGQGFTSNQDQQQQPQLVSLVLSNQRPPAPPPGHNYQQQQNVHMQILSNRPPGLGQQQQQSSFQTTTLRYPQQQISQQQQQFLRPQQPLQQQQYRPINPQQQMKDGPMLQQRFPPGQGQQYFQNEPHQQQQQQQQKFFPQQGSDFQTQQRLMNPNQQQQRFVQNYYQNDLPIQQGQQQYSTLGQGQQQLTTVGQQQQQLGQGQQQILMGQQIPMSPGQQQQPILAQSQPQMQMGQQQGQHQFIIGQGQSLQRSISQQQIPMSPIQQNQMSIGQGQHTIGPGQQQIQLGQSNQGQLGQQQLSMNQGQLGQQQQILLGQGQQQIPMSPGPQQQIHLGPGGQQQIIGPGQQQHVINQGQQQIRMGQGQQISMGQNQQLHQQHPMSQQQIQFGQGQLGQHHRPQMSQGQLVTQQHSQQEIQQPIMTQTFYPGQGQQQVTDTLKSSQIITNQQHHGGGIIRTQLTPQIIQQRMNGRQIMLQQQQQQPFRIQHSGQQVQHQGQQGPGQQHPGQVQQHQLNLQHGNIQHQQQQPQLPLSSPRTPGPQQTQWPQPNQIIRIRSPNATPTDDRRQQQPYSANQQQQMPIQIHSKTKTVLANMLNTRLGNSTETLSPTTPTQPTSFQQPHPPTSPVVPPPTVPSQLNKGPRQALIAQRKNTKMGPRTPTQPQPPRHQFHTHDPTVKLPQNGFLLGCIFWLPLPPPPELANKSDFKQIIQNHGGEVHQQYSYKITHILTNTQNYPEYQQTLREGKRLISFHWLSDICVRKSLSPPFYSIHLPVNANDKPLAEELVCVTGFTKPEDKLRIKNMCAMLGGKQTSTFSLFNTMLVAYKPEGSKYQKAREWRKPVVNIQFLNELMFGQNSLPMIHSPKYQQFNTEQPFRFDIGLVLNLMMAWKNMIQVSGEAIERFNQLPQPPVMKRFKPDEGKEDFPIMIPELGKPPSIDLLLGQPGAEPLGEGQSLLNQDKENQPVIVLSGSTRQLKESTKLKLDKLGCRIVENPKDATHLVLQDGLYTKKFFIALSYVKFIVSMNWVQDSIANGEFVDATPYIIQDPVLTTLYSINLPEILQLPNRNKLLNSYSFYLSENVQPSKLALREIIQNAGGKIMDFHSIKAIISSAENSEKFYIVTCDDDKYLWKGMDASVEKKKILRWEKILETIVRQNIDFTDSG